MKDMKHYTIDKIVEMLKDAADEVDVRDYSGRAMYGKLCLGITGPMERCLEAIAEVCIQLLQEVAQTSYDVDRENQEALSKMQGEQYEAEDWIRTLHKFSQDSMGRSDVVLYWPSIPFSREVEEESEVADG